MKAIRTREEGLDDLRRRRRRLGSSAESAEKKLNKMSSEHKSFGTQTETLNRLREEIRGMDGDIVREEAALGDLKRKCSKNWMTLKFGGLVECCEKGIVRVRNHYLLALHYAHHTAIHRSWETWGNVLLM